MVGPWAAAKSLAECSAPHPIPEVLAKLGVSETLENCALETVQPELSRLVPATFRTEVAAESHRIPEQTSCFHCGEPCPRGSVAKAEKSFCCQGCLFVHELLTESGLERFYDLTEHPGVRVRKAPARDHWNFLDERALQARLLDFTDGKLSRVTLQIPAIHCVACVWLLENLFRLLPGIGASQVNFPRREVSISFSPERVKLSQVVSLLCSIGYEPELNLGQLDNTRNRAPGKRLWLQIGLAGFAFGNIMLFSLPGYLGLDAFSGPAFKKLFGWLSLVLAAPVLVYSASDYWRSALLSVRQRMLTLDVPIAVGLAALYAQSAFEVLSGRGDGYADSLAGLVFFLLCGRAFQQKTHDRIVFDRDYKSFFPLWVSRKSDAGEESIALANLQVGDRLMVRNGEMIPADATLVSGETLIDYSFVTGESEPVPRQKGDHLYAGGQQVGGAIEIETIKAVSQSYLASLWNHETFQKERGNVLDTLTNRYSRRFVRLVIAVAVGAAVFWMVDGNSGRALKAFTSVLIVACPCALALAAPFALGTAQRLLARRQIFVKGTLSLERLAQVDTVVFDKTGTLTTTHNNSVAFYPVSDSDGEATLSTVEKRWLSSLTRHSTHPHSRRIAEALGTVEAADDTGLPTMTGFAEIPGCGIEARIEGHELRLGSRAWLGQSCALVPNHQLAEGSASWLSVDGHIRGALVFSNSLRPHADKMLANVSRECEVALLSGDHERERARFSRLLGPRAQLYFNQTPLKKLSLIQQLQNSGRTVMMVGDGLNDAGALRQSDVGVAVVERTGSFSPASDLILEADQVPNLHRLLRFARSCTRVVRASFGISAIYNIVGVSIAAAGILSPLICAVLMPLSSLSAVLFACGMTTWAANRAGFRTRHSAFRTPHSALRT